MGGKTITILEQSAEEMVNIDQTFDLVYMDPPFGLQRDFVMLEEDGKEKSFSDHWDSFDDYIDWYIRNMGEEACQTVGAYKIEGLGAQLFSKIEGDYFSILGIPLLSLLTELRQHGVILK